ncbi:hypothetical protein [Psychrobacter sp. FDAARGOS_221]|uniref:hypothetical protein n=1 Tax=Psychrobacter sp. FDAARGOS_221 TaxID=1975705 RepID=UPI000BB54264|nr:hypothetical protein [Psychrobacter sp. FDAARGOS_221]PNK61157.1 hypothetical protein A6J60_009940 [Psychrobacter sp. FDAARGOS_221]
MSSSINRQRLKFVTKPFALLIAGIIGIHTPSVANSTNHSLTASQHQDRPALSDIYSPEMLAAYKGFQADADIVRLQQLKYWVDLIEAYHKKTGHYPLQDTNQKNLTVFIATPQQQQYTYQLPGAKYATMKQFINDLEAGLGHSIEERYDPQYAPDVKPNYYIYMLDGDDYFFAIHTHQDYPFSRPVAPDYNKVEVSNRYHPSTPKILTSSMLFKSKAYKQAASKDLQNPEFFSQREALTLHATKSEQ